MNNACGKSVPDHQITNLLSRMRRAFAECEITSMSRNLVTAALALLFFLSLFTNTAVSQLVFDIGDSEIAIRNNTQQDPDVAISLVNLVFDENLKLTHRFEDVLDGTIDPFSVWGYDGPWSFDQAAGDVDYVMDTLGCGEYSIGIASITFRLNLTDAHWGAGSNSSVYKILVDYDGYGDVKLYVRSPGAQGTWSSAIQVSNNDRFTYWGLIRATHDVSYARERTSFGGKTFHVTGSDNLLPLPSTNVTSARLDVNLSVHTDIGVPSGSSLLIEGYYESPAISAYTTLYFDAGTGLTVEGTLSTMEQRFANEWVMFTSSAATPARGDWDGVYASAADLINLNLTFIQYATTGLHTVDCQAVETSSLRILYCDGDGLYSESSWGLHRNLYSNYNGENGARIRTGSTAEFHESSFIGSLAANGIAVLDDAMARVRTSLIYNNYGHGVVGAAAGRIILDSCDVYNNGINGADGWAGVYGLYNDLWITVRHSQIHDQYTGIGMNWAITNGYESSTSPVTWDNPDSLARNCVFNNGFNLFGYYATFELAKPYYDGSVPHYQGGQSSIYYSPPDPTRYQGSFINSQAELERNFWYNNYTFWVQGGSLSTDDPLPADSAGCYFGEPFTGSSGGVINASALTRYRQWETLTPDSLMRTLYAGRQTLESPDLAAGLGLLWRKTAASTVEAFCANVIANSARPEVLLPAYRYVAAARMRDRDWSGARAAFDAMAGQATRAAESSYTGSRAMAALALYLDGDARAARASLDSLLTAFPGDMALRTVETLIGGRAAISTPKAAREMTATPTGIALNEAHPNPFDASTTVAFTLPEVMAAALSVHDINGRVVRRLADGMYPAGRTQLRFDRGDLPAGVYLLRLSAGEVMLTRTVIIVR
jgi:hypothetical protein